MRTSLNEIKEIEDFLLHKKDHSGLETKMLLDNTLYEKMEIQKYLYSVIRQQGRHAVVENIKKAEQVFFKAPRYQPVIRSIYQLFSKKS